jgi:asparagine synthase (glutamine-hydrolysing)
MIDDLKADYVEQALWHLDEPMTDLSAVPLLLVCREAKKHVTVCLSGEGGDESFAGYDRFRASRIDRLYSRLPHALRRGCIEPMVRGLRDRPQKKGAVNMLKRFMEGSALPAEGGHLRWQYFGNEEQTTALFNPAFLSHVHRDPFAPLRQWAARCDTDDVVNRDIYLDLRFTMVDSVLMKVDKMSMASSMEIRVPLLDHVFVEYMAGLPGDWKLRGLETKHIFRSALKGILPPRIVSRGKQGYSLPVKNLLRNELRSYMVTLLNESPLVRDHMNMDCVNQLIREHVDMVHNHNHVLWALMNAALWQRRFRVNT